MAELGLLPVTIIVKVLQRVIVGYFTKISISLLSAGTAFCFNIEHQQQLARCIFICASIIFLNIFRQRFKIQVFQRTVVCCIGCITRHKQLIVGNVQINIYFNGTIAEVISCIKRNAC